MAAFGVSYRMPSTAVLGSARGLLTVVESSKRALLIGRTLDQRMCAADIALNVFVRNGSH